MKAWKLISPLAVSATIICIFAGVNAAEPIPAIKTIKNAPAETVNPETTMEKLQKAAQQKKSKTISLKGINIDKTETPHFTPPSAPKMPMTGDICESCTNLPNTTGPAPHNYLNSKSNLKTNIGLGVEQGNSPNGNGQQENYEYKKISDFCNKIMKGNISFNKICENIILGWEDHRNEK